ncbi:MAG: hypothetical protein J7M14_02895 [Planctomycetes bacterium]|nr:hypothetical protein [Planctomycetota bacterium]
MKSMITSIVIAGCVSCLYAAESATTRPTTRPARTTRISVRPAKPGVAAYNPVAERAKFFKAAGKDNELDAGEFAANLGKTGAFIRKDDKWTTMLRYDRNGNKTIDWFEADAYRRAQIEALIAAASASPGPLGAPEAQMGARRRPGRGAIGNASGGREASDSSNAPRSRGRTTRRRRPQLTPQQIREHDSDGDGQLNRQERREAYQALRHARMLQQYDKNKDGKLDEQETTTMREARRRRMEQMRRRMVMRRFDRDNDGKLDKQEQAAADAATERWRARRRELMARWDTDGDGTLSEEESTAARAAWRRRRSAQGGTADSRQSGRQQRGGRGRRGRRRQGDNANDLEAQQ